MFDHKAMYAAFEGSWEPTEDDSELLDIRLLEQYAREAKKGNSTTGRRRTAGRQYRKTGSNGLYRKLSSIERMHRNFLLSDIYGDQGM